MYAPRSYAAARLDARVAWLVMSLSLILVACAPASAPETVAPEQKAITFENTTNSVVRVYLLGASSEWLLGRVQPAETARLRLPPSFSIDAHEPLALSVVPLGTITRGGGRATARNGQMISADYPLHQLLAMRWGVAGAQLYSVMR
jgi:hypothetical protein